MIAALLWLYKFSSIIYTKYIINSLKSSYFIYKIHFLKYDVLCYRNFSLPGNWSFVERSVYIFSVVWDIENQSGLSCIYVKNVSKVSKHCMSCHLLDA